MCFVYVQYIALKLCLLVLSLDGARKPDQRVAFFSLSESRAQSTPPGGESRFQLLLRLQQSVICPMAKSPNDGPRSNMLLFLTFK